MSELDVVLRLRNHWRISSFRMRRDRLIEGRRSATADILFAGYHVLEI